MMKTNITNNKYETLEAIKKYIDRIFLDKAIAYENNEKHNSAGNIQFIIMGEMIVISEIKRFIKYLEEEKNNE